VAKEQPTEKKRILRPKAETMREKVEKSSSAEPKPRRVREATNKVGAPFKAAGKPVAKIGRYVVPPYFRNSWKELREVTWPKRKESWQLTFAVIMFAIVFGAVVAAVDYGLDKIFKQVLIK
jgi:preprotein translocase SecE subunit